MTFLRLGEAGNEVPVVLQSGAYFDLSPVIEDINERFWEPATRAELRLALAEGRLHEIDGTGMRVGAPIARPSCVVCIGLNYAEHAAESDAAPPDSPVFFLKPPNTVLGPNDPILIPPGSVKTDWEVELGVVIGKRASYLVSPDEANEFIGGYVTVNDVSERAFQLEISGGQWSKGKSAATFCPVGPWLVTPDELQEEALTLRSWVNGERRQEASTADMIFDVGHIIWSLSQYMVLEPGDLICTGTPMGVALSGRFDYLRPGDVVEIEIDGLGPRQRQIVEATELQRLGS